MTKLLKEAMAEAETLSEPAQDRIGRELSAYVKKLHALRADVQQGVGSLDAGAGRALDVEQVIARARTEHGRS